MSPIAVEPKFTRQYINQANNDSLVRRIQQSFDRVTWEKDFAIIEGTGHAGVGSVFDLSNARVARLVSQQGDLWSLPPALGVRSMRRPSTRHSSTRRMSRSSALS